MTRLERITEMEKRMDRVAAVLSSSVPLTPEVMEDVEVLEKYYKTDWLSDYEADEKGLLPEGLRRGVLSEDALYDLLAEADSHTSSTTSARKTTTELQSHIARQS